MPASPKTRKYAAEQGIATENALEQGMREKSAKFKGTGAEIYQKT